MAGSPCSDQVSNLSHPLVVLGFSVPYPEAGRSLVVAEMPAQHLFSLSELSNFLLPTVLSVVLH